MLRSEQVLTTRLGTPVMLALIYSELVKRLQYMGVINFSVDMELPDNLNDLPRPRVATPDGDEISYPFVSSDPSDDALMLNGVHSLSKRRHVDS